MTSEDSFLPTYLCERNNVVIGSWCENGCGLASEVLIAVVELAVEALESKMGVFLPHLQRGAQEALPLKVRDVPELAMAEIIQHIT